MIKPLTLFSEAIMKKNRSGRLVTATCCDHIFAMLQILCPVTNELEINIAYGDASNTVLQQKLAAYGSTYCPGASQTVRMHLHNGALYKLHVSHLFQQFNWTFSWTISV